LLGPITALGASEGSLLFKQISPNAIDAKIERHHQFAKQLAFGDKGLLRSNDPADQEKASVYNELVAGYEGRGPMGRQHALDVSDGIHGSRSIYRHRGCLLRSRTLMSGERIKARARRVRIRVLLPDKHAIPKRSE
jgi:hypothetical protein